MNTIIFCIYLFSAISLNIMLKQMVEEDNGLDFSPFNNNIMINTLSIIPIMNTAMVVRLALIDLLFVINLNLSKIALKVAYYRQKKRVNKIKNNLRIKYLEMGFTNDDANKLINKIK